MLLRVSSFPNLASKKLDTTPLYPPVPKTLFNSCKTGQYVEPCCEDRILNKKIVQHFSLYPPLDFIHLLIFLLPYRIPWLVSWFLFYIVSQIKKTGSVCSRGSISCSSVCNRRCSKDECREERCHGTGLFFCSRLWCQCWYLPSPQNAGRNYLIMIHLKPEMHMNLRGKWYSS